MNKLLLSVLFSAFIVTGVGHAQNPPPAAAPAAAAPAAAVAAPAATETAKPAMKHEHHSELRKALRKLRGAKADLEKAASDFGGHKAKAIEAINHAIEELKDAVESDKK